MTSSGDSGGLIYLVNADLQTFTSLQWTIVIKSKMPFVYLVQCLFNFGNDSHDLLYLYLHKLVWLRTMIFVCPQLARFYNDCYWFDSRVIIIHNVITIETAQVSSVIYNIFETSGKYDTIQTILNYYTTISYPIDNTIIPSNYVYKEISASLESNAYVHKDADKL